LINLHGEFGHNDWRVHALESQFPGSTDAGAVCDLAENSTGIAFAGAPDIYGYAYTGSGGDVGDLQPPLYYAQGIFLSKVNEHINPYEFQMANDGIVAVDSQQGGLLSQDNSSLVHSPDFAKAGVTAITQSAETAGEVFKHLHLPGGGLPEIKITEPAGAPRAGVGRGQAIDRTNYTNQCEPGGPMRQQ
jgi:hypothetical protein